MSNFGKHKVNKELIKKIQVGVKKMEDRKSRRNTGKARGERKLHGIIANDTSCNTAHCFKVLTKK